MLLALNKFREEREEGFTLIELLVVILIIGILSAIAIPAFLNQRKSAVDASAQSDVVNAAKEIENVSLKMPTTDASLRVQPGDSADDGKVTFEALDTSGNVIRTAETAVSDGTRISVSGSTAGNGYTITAFNDGGDRAVDGFVYRSSLGGLATVVGSTGEANSNVALTKTVSGQFWDDMGMYPDPNLGTFTINYSVAEDGTLTYNVTTTGVMTNGGQVLLAFNTPDDPQGYSTGVSVSFPVNGGTASGTASVPVGSDIYFGQIGNFSQAISPEGESVTMNKTS